MLLREEEHLLLGLRVDDLGALGFHDGVQLVQISGSSAGEEVARVDRCELQVIRARVGADDVERLGSEPERVDEVRRSRAARSGDENPPHLRCSRWGAARS